MFSLPSPKQNLILAALPAEDYARLLPYMEFTPMPLGQTIYEPGSPITHLYFPTNSIVAPLYGMQNGASVRLAIIGNEGLPAFPRCWAAAHPGRRCSANLGQWIRVKTNVIKKEFDLKGKLQYLVFSFTQALMTKTAQTPFAAGTIISSSNCAVLLDEPRPFAGT